MSLIKKAWKILKWTGALLLVLVLLGTSFLAHEWWADKPFFFRNYLDREAVKHALDRPETLTWVGVLEKFGINGHNAELNDVSQAKLDELYTRIPIIRNGINQYKDEELDEEELITKQICQYLLEMSEKQKEFRFHNYPANQMFGIQNNYPGFMTSQHTLESLEDAENYLSRLEKVRVKFDQYMEGLIIRENMGILPPRFVVDRILEEMGNFIGPHPRENILYTSLSDKLRKIVDLRAEDEARILVKAEEKITNYVYPAYQSFIEYFESVAPKTGKDDGFWSLPKGKEAYAFLLKQYTSTDYSPEYIHNLGLSEIDRIQREILRILADQGIDTSKGFASAMHNLSKRSEFYYPDNDHGRQQILEDYQSILDEINEGLESAFRIGPEAGLEVVRIPEFKEKTAPAAYYMRPSFGGDRPGKFFVNLHDVKTTEKYGMRTLAYHEGIPGHHFQISIAMELKGVPIIRRMAPSSAYSEGWALYAEQLAWEMGFQENPFDNVGRLSGELFRAVRLVVDTGIHEMKWTREKAIQFMKENTGAPDKNVVAEIERYIVMPGQATAYKVGMIKILELRNKAQTKLGDAFYLPDFHNVVLKNGAVPLTILETIIDNYIRDTKLGESM